MLNIGIIVYSKTGNTFSVAQRIQDKLKSAGHSVTIERVTAMNDDPKDKGEVQLKERPDITPYDALVFGTPVWAFSLPSVMQLYLSQLTGLNGKKTGYYATQQFPYAWMGGNRTLRQMKKICESKSANSFETGVINWSNKEREKQISNLAETIAKTLTK